MTQQHAVCKKLSYLRPLKVEEEEQALHKAGSTTPDTPTGLLSASGLHPAFTPASSFLLVQTSGSYR